MKQLKRLENRLNSIKEVSILSQMQDVNIDIILTLCGEKLGSGAFRSVYEFNLDPSKYVVKIEPMNHDCNLTEFMLWDEIRGLKGKLEWVKDWFAPVRYCSPNGKILIMERTKQLNKPRPDKVPDFLSDVKIDNFGWLNGKFVCHDYGFIYKFTKYENKFQKIDW